ncbi:unnamed protein product, partial [marine sediment metagenome]
VLFFAFLLSQFAAAQQLPLKNLDEYIEKAIKDWNVAGMAIAIVKDDTVVYAKGFGYKNVDEKTEIDEHTLFAIGSTSKAFTAALMGMLVDEEKVRWDDKVTQHLPEFQLYDPYVTREFTIRDLLCHRSGLSRGDQLWFGSTFSRDEILYRIRYLEPSWSFRSHYGYQNIMFLIAGQLIAQVTGKSWDDNVKERIFLPLGMNETNTSINDFKPGDNAATPHQRTRDTLRTIPWRDIDNIGPAGSINSNVVDMAKWLRLQLGNGTFEAREFWSSDIQREMHSPQTITSGLRTGLSHFSLYGLAWSLRDYRGKFIASHSGSIDGMNASVGLMPEENLGVVQLSNVNGNPIMSNLMNRIFDAYLGVPEDEWRDVGQPREPSTQQRQRRQEEQPPPEDTKPSLPLERYAGTYENKMVGNVKVELKDGKLTLDFEGYPDAVLEHRHLDTFRYTFKDKYANSYNLTFIIDASARISGINMQRLGEFRRVGR